jgi:hypothetical protein
MATYQITSTQGADHGEWQGETAGDALAAMHRAAGYTVQYDAAADALLFAAPADVALCGTLSDWTVEAR